MSDLIDRQAAIDALWKALYEYEDKTEEQFLESEELNIATWFLHRIFVQNMNDIDRQTILNLPSAQSWIPVTERLPKPNEKDEDGIQKYYLIQNEFGDMMVAAYREKNLAGDTWWEQMYAYKPIEDKVISWMPLPELYREEIADAEIC